MNPRKRSILSEQIQRHLSDILEKNVSDPRLLGVTVNRVVLSSDGASARVFLSKVGTPEEEEDCRTAVPSVVPFLRKRLAGLLETRTVPALILVYDRSIQEGEEVLRVLRNMEKGSPGD